MLLAHSTDLLLEVEIFYFELHFKITTTMNTKEILANAYITLHQRNRTQRQIDRYSAIIERCQTRIATERLASLLS